MIKVDESDPVGELEPSFPYKDITIRRGVDMKEHYELQSEIGRGKFGTVFKCREKATGLMLAAKFVGIVHKQDRRNVEREVEIMCELQHPRLIQLYDAFESNNAMCFILELVEGGELFERVIGDDFVLTEKAVTIFMRQICEGVQFIHSKNILHLDLKPENILCLTKTGNRIKIIDFGLARKFNPDNKLQVLFGTPEFVAPEVVNFDAIGFGTDMWSVGVICYVLLSGLSPFMGETDVETMANVTIAQYDFDDEAFDSISNDAKDFIKKLLVKDHKSRPTATECLAHRWMTQKKKSKKTVRAKPTIRQTGIERVPEAARDASLPLAASKENLKELCGGTKSRSQSPAKTMTTGAAAVVVAATVVAATPVPSPNSTLLQIQRHDELSSPPPSSSSDGTTVHDGTDGSKTAAAESASSRPSRDNDVCGAVTDDRALRTVVDVVPAGGSPQTIGSGQCDRPDGDGSRTSADQTNAATFDGRQWSSTSHRTKCEPPETVADVPSRVKVGGSQTTTSTWSSKTTVRTTTNNNNSGYRRTSDVCTSYRVFSSFRTDSVAADDFLESELRGLSDRLQTMFDGRTAESGGVGAVDDLHALLSNRPGAAERKAKFKFVNRDVPAGSPSEREPTTSASAACKDMLLKLFYGGAAADKTVAAATEPELST